VQQIVRPQIKRALEGAVGRVLRHPTGKESQHHPGDDVALITRRSSRRFRLVVKSSPYTGLKPFVSGNGSSFVSGNGSSDVVLIKPIRTLFVFLIGLVIENF
jgi:hypothetical protein